MKQHLGYTGLGFALGYRAGGVLPRGVCRGIGGALALASYMGSPRHRLALRQNLKVVTGVNGSTLDRICRENFQNFGRMLADYFYCAGIQSLQKERVLAMLGEWQGIENLRAAHALGRGVVLITAHLGNWELGGALLALEGWPINVVTLPEPSTELTRMRDEHRRRLGIRTIAVGEGQFAFVDLLAALRRNEIVCMLVDRPRAGTGVPVEFFGGETCFSTGPALLWEHTGAAVVPAFVLRNRDGCYQAFAEPPVELERAPDHQESVARNTQLIADACETKIRQHPEQWFNYVPIWKNETASLSHANNGQFP